MTTPHKPAKPVALQAAELRNRAEESVGKKAAGSPMEPKALSPDQTIQAIHELRVHQIELEMQNDELRQTQAELDAALKRYFDLYDMAPVGYCTVNENGLILEANFTAATMLGVTREALIKQPLTCFILPEDQDIYYRYRKQLFGSHATRQRHADASSTCELRMVREDNTPFWAWLEATAAQDAAGATVCRLVMTDMRERKQAEAALIESEQRVQKKLNSILLSEENIGDLELADIIDVDAIQAMMDVFFKITRFSAAIIDSKGKILVKTGWQDICTKFHRVHPETLKKCIECDTILTQDIPAGTSKSYLCMNNLWDNATPLIVGGKKVGNLFTGQFFYEGEQPNDAVFRAQAARYGFDEQDYMAALRRVPILKREEVQSAMVFYTKIAHMIMSLSFANIGLTKTIEERNQAEEALRLDSQIMTNMADGVYLIRASDFVIVYANDRLEKMFGYAHGELIGQKVSIVNAPSDISPEETARNIIEALSRNGVWTGEIKNMRKDGTAFWCSASVASFEHRAFGRVWISVHHDITERRKAEAALRVSEERHRTILQTAMDGFWLADAEGRLLEVNETYSRMSGYHMQELQAMNISDLEAAENAVDTANHMRKIRAQGEARFESRHRRKDGSVFDVEVSVQYQSGERQMVAFLRDITARKRAEVELLNMQRLQSVGTLAGGIAHDFNNILMGLFAYVSVAKDELAQDHPSFKMLDKAEVAMNRAVRLTNQLLTFAKGGLPVKADLSLGKLVEEVAQFDLSGSNVMLAYSQVPDLWLAEVDKGQLQQVVSNLTINAMQAMPSGGHLYIALENVEIKEDALPTLHQGKYVRITVRDEGIGIDQNHISRIFDPYFTTKQTGSGLGLATTYSIINKHGGHIGVVSELGKGTTFTIHLPASGTSPRAETKEAEAERPIMNRAARILVMDDEDTIRDSVAIMLAKMGCTTATAADGPHTIELYQKARETGAPFDVVVLDLTIPGGMGGKDVIKDILAIDANAKVIVSSGYADDAVMARHTEYGFKGVVAKPYTPSDLRKVLRNVLLQ